MTIHGVGNPTDWYVFFEDFDDAVTHQKQLTPGTTWILTIEVRPKGCFSDKAVGKEA
jgi:hypothetical protein